MNLRRTILLALALAPALAGCESRPTVETDIQTAQEIRKVLEQGGGTAKKKGAADKPTGFATITGVFRFPGEAPPRAPLALGGDDAPTCRAAATQPHLDESLIVGPGGALKNALVFVSSEIPDEPGWIHESYATLPEPPPFDQEDCIFTSHVYAMLDTQSVKILNSDQLGHNTNISGGEEASAFNQLVPSGGSIQYTPGGPSGLPMSVTCNIHPWMKAYMMVADNPYFAVTGEDGQFTLANVPAGVELELRAWQETNQLEFSDSTGEWSRGRKTITLQPGQTLELEISASMK